jgi:hypothetical protein
MDLPIRLRLTRIRKGEVGPWSLILLALLCLSISGLFGPLPLPHVSCVSITDDVFGDIIIVDKPVPAVVIGEGDIPVGEAHTYTYNLKQGHRYHVYLTGDWVNPKSPETDYDLYVYKISGTKAHLRSTHTESAGLAEQVGNDGLEQYFVPSEAGTYYFTVRNDKIESSAAEAATLMVIERIDLNRWIGKNMKGKVNEKPVDKTTWAYEFVTSAPRIQVSVDVPSTLDMYEARLYAMANPSAGKGQLLSGIPVAWEPGLRAQVSGAYGGFNLDPQGFRHVSAMASCEKSGDDMVIDYEAPASGELLYHLVLIAEYGEGLLSFIVQTDFQPPVLQLIDPPATVEAGEPTRLEVSVSDDSEIVDVSFSYSRDGGDSWRQADVEPGGDGLYGAVVKGVDPGDVVEYVFEAEDEMGNLGDVGGEFSAIGSASLSLYLDGSEIPGGGVAESWGWLNPGGRDVTVTYIHDDDEFEYALVADDYGYFNHSYEPTSAGDWQIYASYAGDEDYYPATTERLNFTVTSLRTELTCEVSRERIEFKKSLIISGEFSLEKGVQVELTLMSKDEVKKLSERTSQEGSYALDFEPGSKGRWTVRAKVAGDGLVYEGATSDLVEFEVVNPSLTTSLLRLPSIIAAKAGPLIKPPLLYGVIGVVGIAAGGVVFYIRRRE